MLENEDLNPGLLNSSLSIHYTILLGISSELLSLLLHLLHSVVMGVDRNTSGKAWRLYLCIL